MITGKMKFKRPKLTVDQKALKKAVTTLAKQLKTDVRAGVPKKTGALRFAVDYKSYSVMGASKAVIGVKSRYSRTVKGKEKIPNKYATKAGTKVVLRKHINQSTVEKLSQEVSKVKQELLKS